MNERFSSLFNLCLVFVAISSMIEPKKMMKINFVRKSDIKPIRKMEKVLLKKAKIWPF
ncbi:hypothetical protein FPFC_030660 [Fructobacillus pseudoficulneus]|uniref:Uncharacterized protein n=1 Tax=Fructobacillus pseudoficulneus TaxID=220714 RepID=A0A3F3GVJ9_9LACO|nr:hypothetical protein FPFC_030660 [Fructobacillus pseudoficulneus]